MDRKSAIKIVSELNCGYQEDLIAKIGERYFHQFSMMGFIKKGVTSAEGKSRPSWKITEQGKMQSDFYRDPTPEEVREGMLLYSLGVL